MKKILVLSLLMIIRTAYPSSQEEHKTSVTHDILDIKLLQEVNHLCLTKFVRGTEINRVVSLSQEKIDRIKNPIIKQQAKSSQDEMIQTTHNAFQECLRDLDDLED